SRPSCWLKRSRARPSSPRPWSMRRTCGWWTSNRPSTGTAAATSSLPPPRPCAASSWRVPAASTGNGMAGGGARAPPAAPPRLGALPAVERTAEDLLALDDALTRLAAEDPAAADLVKLRFYAGFSVEEAADALAISRAQGYRHWKYARAWLRCALDDEPAAP